MAPEGRQLYFWLRWGQKKGKLLSVLYESSHNYFGSKIFSNINENLNAYLIISKVGILTWLGESMEFNILIY